MPQIPVITIEQIIPELDWHVGAPILKEGYYTFTSVSNGVPMQVYFPFQVSPQLAVQTVEGIFTSTKSTEH